MREDAIKPSMGYALLSVALGLLLAPPALAQNPTVSLATEYLMTLEIQFDPALQPMGSRLIANIPLGGAVHGPKINGAFIAPAGDWVYMMPDGSFRLDVRATIKTDDGELIFIEYGAVAVPNKGAMDRVDKGETITTKDAYWITTPRFTTVSKKYAWLKSTPRLSRRSMDPRDKPAGDGWTREKLTSVAKGWSKGSPDDTA
jgi:hypothetical protein